MAKRNIIYGNAFFKEITSKTTQKKYSASYWDLWIAIALNLKFDNDWSALIDGIEPKDSYRSTSNYEAVSSHILNLEEELTMLGLDVNDILLDEDPEFLKKQGTKAIKKLLNLDFQGKEKTKWMIDTPKKLLYEKAINGNWESFVVNPKPFAIELQRKFKKSGYYRKGETFKFEEKLQRFLDKNTKKATVPKQIAVYRAFLAVLLTKMDMMDDSYGVIGGLYQETFEQYINIDRKELKIHPEIFLIDVLELMLWEDYGGIDYYKTAFFQNLSSDEVMLAELILKDRMETLWELKITYQAENALSMLAVLYAQHKIFDKFVPLAKKMEARHWQRIIFLVDTAKENGEKDLAVQVLEASLVEEGFHSNYLKEAYDKLLKE